MPRGRARKEKCLLKGKADDYVNGYGGSRTGPQDNRVDRRTTNRIQTEEEMYDDYDSEPDEDRLYDLTYMEKMEKYVNELDIESEKMKELLVLNEDIGYLARTRCIHNIFPDSRVTDDEDNEAGWINEYWFGKEILPKKYGIVDWEPSIEKYYDLKLFDDPWDFRLPNLSIDVKTQAKQTYAAREYICPESKLKVLKTDDFAIWWAQCNYAEDVIKGRDSPMLIWKYYENKKTIWDTYDKIPRPLHLYEYLIGNKSSKQLMENTQAILKPPTAGDFSPGNTSDQLYFQLDVLKTYNTSDD